MNKLIIVLMSFFLVSAVFAQDEDPVRIEPRFAPQNPIVMGQGGSFTANAEGYNSFFLNPAGFAKKSEFTIVSANPWLYTTSELLDWVTDPENPVLGAIEASEGSNTMSIMALSDEQQALIDSYMADAGIELDLDEVDWEQIAIPEEVASLTNAPEGATAETIITMLAEGTLEVDENALEAEFPDTDFANMTVDEIADFTDEIIAEYAGEMLIDLAEQALDLPPGFIRVGANIGASVIAGGVGVGVFGLVDANFDGSSILSTGGALQATGAGVVGYAHTLSIGSMALHIGADVRPMAKYKLPFVAGDLISDLIQGTMISADYILEAPSFVATTVGFDLGAILDIGPLSVGISVRDLFNTRYQWYATNFNTLTTEMSMPEGEPVFESFTPMSVNIGASFHPDFGKLSILLDPRFHVDIKNIAFVKEFYEDVGILDMINLGAEITVLKFLSARAGFSGGYFTAGVGAKLLFLEANIAAVVDAVSLDEVTDFGVSAEIALRF
jgi:hypothetical protein